MAISAAELIAIVAVRGADEAALKLAMVGKSADNAGKMMAGLAVGGAVLAGAAFVGLGVVAVKMAADFQQGVNRLKTGAGDTTDNLTKLGQGILKVSTATGILTNGTDGLNAAMYQIISSGQRGAQSLNTLAAASQGAQIEQAKVVDVAKILTTIQTNFGLSTHTAAQYMDGLVAAVAHGKINLEELSTAMSPILPFSHQLGIHFADVAAAMSDMTNQGIPANQAATALRFTMQSMILPTHASQVAMQQWGLDSAKVAETMKTSLPDAIQMYITAADRAGGPGTKPMIDALAEMMGGGQRAAKALFSLSQSMGQWRQDIGLVNTALADTNKNVAGWETVQTNLNLQLDRGKAVLASLAIQAGTVLLPIVTNLVKGFADWATHTDFSWLIGRVKETATELGNVFDLMGRVASFTINSQSWKDAATNIGGAAQQLGVFIQNLQKIDSSNLGIQAVKGTIKDAGDSTAQLGGVFQDAFTVFNYLLDRAAGRAQSLQSALFQIGEAGKTGMINASDAAKMLDVGIKMVTDSTTGADINIAKLAKTSDLSGSSTVTLAHALELVGKSGNDILTTADAAKLLAMHIGNVKDMTTGYVEDLKTMIATQSTAWNPLRVQEYAAWLKVVKAALDAGKTTFISFDDFVKQTEANTNKQLHDTSQGASTLRSHLLALNGNSMWVSKNNFPIVDNDSKKTRQHLLDLNGTSTWVAKTNLPDVVGAANNARARLLALNGGSMWVSNVVTNYTTQGQPGGFRGFASGTESAPGGMALVGEQGPELVNLPRGSRVNTAAQTRTMLAGGSGGGGQQVVEVHVYLNKGAFARELSEPLLDQIVTRIRNATGARF